MGNSKAGAELGKFRVFQKQKRLAATYSSCAFRDLIKNLHGEPLEKSESHFGISEETSIFEFCIHRKIRSRRKNAKSCGWSKREKPLFARSLAFGSARSGEFHELPTVDLALFEILIKDYSREPKGAFE